MKVYALCLSADLSLLVTTCEDGFIRVFDLPTCQCHVTLAGHVGAVRHCSITKNFSLQEGLIASGGIDAKVMLWSPKEAKPLLVLTGHLSSVTRTSFSKDDKLLATSSVDGTVCVWSIEKWGDTPLPPSRFFLISMFNAHEDSLSGCAFLPNSMAVLSWGSYADPTIKEWYVREVTTDGNGSDQVMDSITCASCGCISTNHLNLLPELRAMFAAVAKFGRADNQTIEAMCLQLGDAISEQAVAEASQEIRLWRSSRVLTNEFDLFLKWWTGHERAKAESGEVANSTDAFGIIRGKCRDHNDTNHKCERFMPKASEGSRIFSHCSELYP